MADSFPLYMPPEARRPFQSESLLRRFAQLAHWNGTSRLLELHGSLGALAITRALSCHLTIVEPDARLAAALKERARTVGLEERVVVQHGVAKDFKFVDDYFHGVLAFGRVVGLPGEVAKYWRRYLVANGRLGLTVMVRVGRARNEQALAKWKDRVGSPIPSAREAMMAIEAEGYEPELIESLGESELDEYYQELEQALEKTIDTDAAGTKALKEEIALHRSGNTGVTLAFAVARAKEPGEKPPPSRDGG